MQNGHAFLRIRVLVGFGPILVHFVYDFARNSLIINTLLLNQDSNPDRQNQNL